MGCQCSKSRKIMVSKNLSTEENLNKYLINIHIPKTDNVKILSLNINNENETLSNIFKSAFFNKEEENKYNANFISLYNPVTNNYDYYIETLLNYKIENEDHPKKGKMWNIYINNEKVNWDYKCDNQRTINFQDKIDLKFEKNNDKILSDSFQSKEFNSSDSSNFK